MSPSPEAARPMFPSPEGDSRDSGPRGLSWYILWRVVGAVMIVFLVLTLIFVAVEVVPADPSRTFLPRGGYCPPGGNATACKLPAQILQQWGLDKPLFERYLIFLGNVFTGNLGTSVSYRHGTPVWSIIAPTLPTTLAFVGGTMLILALLSLLIGMPLGRRKGGLLDGIASFLLALLFAVPASMLGLVLLYLFAVQVRIFPLVLSTDPLGQLSYYVLPELTLLGATLGLFVWVVRDHPLRPSSDLLPRPPGDWHSREESRRTRTMAAVSRFVATLPILFPWTVGGVMLGEMVFNINGAGLLLWSAIQQQDFFLLTGTVIVLALLVLLPVLVVADVLHYALTRRWRRADGLRVDEMRVDARDPWRGLQRVLTSALGLTGLVLILAVVIGSATAPLLVGPYQLYSNLSRPFLPPSLQHPLGTDAVGRDLLNHLAYGGQPAIGTAILAFALALIAGLGVLAGVGLFGERAAVFLVLPVDLFLVLSVPFAFLLVTAIGAGTVVWAPALVGWPVATRILLLETTGIVPSSQGPARPGLSIRERGNRSLNFIWSAGPLILADALLAVALSIGAWAFFGSLGLGPAGAGTVESWGQMVGDAYNNLAILRGMWWYFLSPILCISLAVLGPALMSLELKRIGLRRPRIRERPVTIFPAASVPPLSDSK